MTSVTGTVKRTLAPYTAQRVTLTSTKPLKQTLEALYEELNKDKAGLALLKMMATVKTKQDVVSGIDALTEGKRDFMWVSYRVIVH